MTLLEKIESDMRSAQKAVQAERLSTLRLVLAQLQNRKIELHRELTDTEAEQVMQKEIKKRKEAIVLYERGNRPDLAAKESNEIKIIAEYLPPPLASAEVESVVKAMVTGGEKDFGRVMRLAKEKLGERVDGRELSEVVKKVLSL
ncbi:MAG: GatB/YqeY domain-containing protein [Candidatus Liptonbacteria bacterium]